MCRFDININQRCRGEAMTSSVKQSGGLKNKGQLIVPEKQTKKGRVFGLPKTNRAKSVSASTPKQYSYQDTTLNNLRNTKTVVHFKVSARNLLKQNWKNIYRIIRVLHEDEGMFVDRPDVRKFLIRLMMELRDALVAVKPEHHNALVNRYLVRQKSKTDIPEGWLK